MINLTAEVNKLIDRYQLIPHPEGGWYRELHRSKLNIIRSDAENRSAFTMILFLLPSGHLSRWHRVANADESWHYIAGEASHPMFGTVHGAYLSGLRAAAELHANS